MGILFLTIQSRLALQSLLEINTAPVVPAVVPAAQAHLRDIAKVVQASHHFLRYQKDIVQAVAQVNLVRHLQVVLVRAAVPAAQLRHPVVPVRLLKNIVRAAVKVPAVVLPVRQVDIAKAVVKAPVVRHLLAA